MALNLRLAVRRIVTSAKPCIRQASNMRTAQVQPVHGTDESGLWKKLFLFVAIPVMGFCTYNGFFSEEAKHGHARPEFIPYSHLRIRIRQFPWGDGNHSLIHSHYNALPEGYEDEE